MTLLEQHQAAARQSKIVTRILWLMLAKETTFFDQSHARILADQEYGYPKEFALAKKLHARIMPMTYPRAPRKKRRA